jgi:tripartite-type tricarboxylate transporter receptor subunit TctC
MAALLFERTAGVQMTHMPFKGGAPALTAVASDDVDITFGTPPSVLPLAQTGRVKALAVTSLERSKGLPDLPTVHELNVKGFDFTDGFGLYAPAGLPADITDSWPRQVPKCCPTRAFNNAWPQEAMRCRSPHRPQSSRNGRRRKARC